MNRFQIGDELRIRSWEDMAEEFGVTEQNFIRCSEGIVFISSMRHMCGKRFVVRSINNNRYKSVDNVECGCIITASMLEYDMDNINIEKITDDEFLNIIEM